MNAIRSIYYLFVGAVWFNIAIWMSTGVHSNEKVIGFMAWTIGTSAIVELISTIFKEK